MGHYRRQPLGLAAALLIIVAVITQAAASWSQGETGLLIVATFSSLADEVDMLLGNACPREYYILAHGEIDPHTYTLTPRDLEALQAADLIISTEHTPFEERIRKLVESGELQATYLGVTSLEGIKLLTLPGENALNTHFPIYHPSNYRVFLQELAQILETLCPQAKEQVHQNLDKALNKLGELEATLASTHFEALIATPPSQYALEGLSVRVAYLLVPEPEAGLSPGRVERALELLGKGGMIAGVLSTRGGQEGWKPATPADEWLLTQARSRGIPVVWVPHPLERGSVLSKLDFIRGQLMEASEPPALEGSVPRVNASPLLAPLLVILLLLVLGTWLVSYQASRGLGGLSGRAKVLALMLAASLLFLAAACRGSAACSLSWVGVMVGAGVALGGLSGVMGVRRLFFLAAAVPHMALLSASLGLLVELYLGGWFKAWALAFNVALLLASWRALERPGASDRVVALLVGATGSLSVVVLYYLTGRLGAGYSVASIVLGDPLLTGVSGSLIVLASGLVALVYISLTFREHVVIGLNRSQALLAGLRVGLYDVSLVIILAAVGVLVLDVVGFILAHILFLLPGSAALSSSRRGPEVLVTSVSLGLSSSLAGLGLAILTGLSPAGLLGLVLLAQFAVLHLVRR